jgi:hypothetical protein
MVRRRVRAVTGEIEYVDGSREPVTAGLLMRAPETALKLLGAAVVAIAVALLVG